MSSTPANVARAMIFDSGYYYADNHDIAHYADQLGLSGPERESFALHHYMAVGWKEAWNPNAHFDSWGYLRTHQDVRDAGINPWQHYREHAHAEPHRLPVPVPAPIGEKLGVRILIPAILDGTAQQAPAFLLPAPSPQTEAFTGFAPPAVEAMQQAPISFIRGCWFMFAAAPAPAGPPSTHAEAFAVLLHAPDTATALAVPGIDVRP